MPKICVCLSIHGLCHDAREIKGLSMFGELKLRDYPPDLITYTTMVDGLCRVDGIVDAWNLWMEMVAKEITASDHDKVKSCTTRCAEGDSPIAQ